MTEGALDHIKLPERLVSSVDLSRTIRELQALNESVLQAQLRTPGSPTHLSRSGITLEELAHLNGIKLTDESQREQLIKLLQAFEEHATRIHMSVAVEPSARFTRQIIVWLRTNINPAVLLEIGLQPTLAAGCLIRTPNRVFDMSLRHRFSEQRGLLLDKISLVGEAAEAKKDAEVQA